MNTEMITRPDLEVTKRHKLRNGVQKIGFLLAILAPLTFIIAGLGSKIGLWHWSFGLSKLSLKLGPLLLLLGLVFGIVGILLWFFVRPRKGIVLASIATIIPLLGLVQLGSAKSKVESLPYIHDITTNTQSPPVFSQAIIDARSADGATNTLDYVGKTDREGGTLVSVLQNKAYPEIRPVLRSEDKAVVFGEALSLVKQAGWDIVTEDANSGVIEATASTFWYGFKDDVVIQVRESEGGGTIVNMRSVSRVGQSDIGANARRLSALIDGLNQ